VILSSATPPTIYIDSSLSPNIFLAALATIELYYLHLFNTQAYQWRIQASLPSISLSTFSIFLAVSIHALPCLSRYSNSPYLPSIKLSMLLYQGSGYRVKEGYVEIIGGIKLSIIGWDRRYD
jgi:hypothetical protein